MKARKNTDADGRQKTNPYGSSSDSSRRRSDPIKILSKMSKINCRPNKTEQNRDWLQAFRCLSRFCSRQHQGDAGDFGFRLALAGFLRLHQTNNDILL